MARQKLKNLLLLKQIQKAVAQIKKGKLKDSLKTLDKAEKSASDTGSTDALYYILFTRGGILYSAASYEEALATYQRALEISNGLITGAPENVDYQHYTGTTLNIIGDLLRRKGELAAAKESYARSDEVYKTLLSKDPENLVFQSYAGTNLTRYGDLLAETGSFEEAKEALERAVAVYEAMLAKKPDQGYQADFASASSRLGNCLVRLGGEKAELAKQHLEKALQIQESLLGTEPENETMKTELALTRKWLDEA